VTSGTSDIPLTLTPKNSDPDDMPDGEERLGYKDPYGNTRTSDPTLADTDGDGLSDSYEAGDLTTDANGHTFRKMRSNPVKVDSDTDALDDYLELMDLGTNPLLEDTDHDLLSDGREWETGTDPKDSDTDGDRIGDYERYSDKYLDQNYISYLPWKDIELAREFTLGLAKGDWASADHHDNLGYQAGQFISNLFSVGSARDAYVANLHGDSIGTILNGIGTIPGGAFESAIIKQIGVGGKVTPHFLGFVGEGKITYKIAQANLPANVIDLLKSKGLSETRIAKLLEKTALKGFDLSKVTHAAELNGKYFIVHITDQSGEMKYFLQSIDGERYIPIRNGEYAGKIHPSGVHFDSNGFPIFDAKASINLNPSSYTKSVGEQFKESSKKLYDEIQLDPTLKSKFTPDEIEMFKQGNYPVEKYRWHHYQDEGKMQLVDKTLHESTGHTGGVAIWGERSVV
jgi:hypothetical protein